MGAADIDLEFDRENDIIYVIKKGVDKKKVTSIEARAGIVFKIHIKTKEVVGLIFHHVSFKAPRLCRLSDYELMEEFEDRLRLLNDYHEAEQRA